MFLQHVAVFHLLFWNVVGCRLSRIVVNRELSVLHARENAVRRTGIWEQFEAPRIVFPIGKIRKRKAKNGDVSTATARDDFLARLYCGLGGWPSLRGFGALLEPHHPCNNQGEDSKEN